MPIDVLLRKLFRKKVTRCAGRLEEREQENALLSELHKLKLVEETIPQQINEMQEQLEVQTEARRREEQGTSSDCEHSHIDLFWENLMRPVHCEQSCQEELPIRKDH
jgi:hypothetical protein